MGIKRIAERFVPSWIEGAPNRRLMHAYRWVRLGPAASALALTWTFPASGDEKVRAALLLGLVAIPYLATVSFLAARRPSPLVRIATVVGDLAIVFLLHATIPQIRFAALLGYLVFTSFYAYLGGWRAGLTVAGISVGLVLVVNTGAAVDARIDAFTLGVWASATIAMAGILDVLSREQRRAAQRLSLLHRSLEAVSSSVEIDEMLGIVATTAAEAPGARSVAVLLVEGEDIRLGTVRGPLRDRNGTRPFSGAGLEPSRDALRTREPVVIERFAGHPVYAALSEVAGANGVIGMVAAPMVAAGEAVGVVSACFARPGQVDAEATDLLRAFANQAASALVRARAYERERQAAARLREVDGLKDEFLATVSHELRTPLTSIKGFAATLLRKWDGFDNTTRLELLELIHRNSGDLQQLIEQLLDFSRLDAGRVEPALEDLRLEEVITDCVRAHGPTIDAARVRIEIPPRLTVRADPHALERILANLLTNAAKFSPAGAPIDVRGITDDGMALVSVRDRGAGIELAEQERIFEPFTRAVDPDSDVAGTGIGLAVVRRHIDLHGGRIWVESRPGLGATFLFTLPLAPIQLPAVSRA